MAKLYLPEELNNLSKETLVALILSMQDQLSQLNANMERLIEQIASGNALCRGTCRRRCDLGQTVETKRETRGRFKGSSG